MSSTREVPLVLQGIQQVIAAFAENGIAKNRKNESQGFKFRGIDDVMNRMAEQLAAANLVIAPNIISREVHERTNSRGNPLFYVTVQVNYTIYSTVDGSSIVCCVPGEAMDTGDKATNKALSIAYKYMAFQLFAIPIDEDPDATTHALAPKADAPKAEAPKVAAPPELISMDEAILLTELGNKAGVDEAMICKAAGVKSIGEFPKAKLAAMIERLQKKISTHTKE